VSIGTEGNEAAAVRSRYARRHGDSQRYSLLEPAALYAAQERQRAIAGLLRTLQMRDVDDIRLLEVGCGTGMNLLEFLRMGFRPENLQGIELLAESVQRARCVLPPAVRIIEADASQTGAGLLPGSQDIVYQATVFSSLLDDAFQQQMAAAMWQWVRPGGGVLWYDFTVDNPRNPDVRGVSVRRIRQLFPAATIRAQRVTLAPPLARAVTRIDHRLYPFFNTCAWLRTHVLVWIAKEAPAPQHQ
jgi:SAM-dependent methyltransferase